MLMKEDIKKSLALMVLLLIYLFLPIFLMSLIGLLGYTLYRWLSVFQAFAVWKIINNVLLTFLLLLLSYTFRLLIIWIRE